MFPETEFHKLGNRLMFLVIEGRIYHTDNSGNSGEGFLSLCGLNFPLIKAETIEEIENRYYRKAKNEIKEFKAKQIGELNDKYLKILEEMIKKKEDSIFFFREICPAYNLNFNNQFVLSPLNILSEEKKVIQTQEDSNLNLLRKILPEKCAVINGRVYPISFSQDNVFVDLNNQSYELLKSTSLLDEIEETFQAQFEERLKKEANFEFETGKEKKEKVSILEKELGSLEVIHGIDKYEHCYEYGEIGYEFSSKLIYWLIKPHYNSTTERSYSEGQSAVTLELDNKKLGNSVKFVERGNRDTLFSIHSHSNCYGQGTKMPPFDDAHPDSIEDKMYMLKTCAEEVSREGNFWTAPDSSSSDDSSSDDNSSSNSSSDYNY